MANTIAMETSRHRGLKVTLYSAAAFLLLAIFSLFSPYKHPLSILVVLLGIGFLFYGLTGLLSGIIRRPVSAASRLLITLVVIAFMALSTIRQLRISDVVLLIGLVFLIKLYLRR